MPLIDIGVNLAHNQFQDDLQEVLSRSRERGVETLIVIGTSVEHSLEVQQLCDTWNSDFPDMLYGTVGVHPHDAREFSAHTSAELQVLLDHPCVVAVGETGLDFNRNYSSAKDQEKAFEAQLELAAISGLPVFMHERDAHQRQYEILRHYRDSFDKGVIHCFTGDRTALFNYLDLNLYIGITGWICDERRGLELQRLVHNIPLERLMLETDAPYLLPRTIDPKPTVRRNEPAYLPWVLTTVAQHRPESAATIAAATTATAQAFFGL